MKFHPSATVGGSSAIIFLFISHPRDCSGVPTAGGREQIPTLKKTEGGKNTTCPQTSSCRLIRVRLTEISIAPPPSCSGPPPPASPQQQSSRENIFQARDSASAGQTGSAQSGARCDSYGGNNLVLAPEGGGGGGGYFS